MTKSSRLTSKTVTNLTSMSTLAENDWERDVNVRRSMVSSEVRIELYAELSS